MVSVVKDSKRGLCHALDRCFQSGSYRGSGLWSAVLGWPCFRELAALTTIPVYALGGMTADTLAEARKAGAYGIAAIRSLWGGVVD